MTPDESSNHLDLYFDRNVFSLTPSNGHFIDLPIYAHLTFA